MYIYFTKICIFGSIDAGANKVFCQSNRMCIGCLHISSYILCVLDILEWTNYTFKVLEYTFIASQCTRLHFCNLETLEWILSSLLTIILWFQELSFWCLKSSIFFVWIITIILPVIEIYCEEQLLLNIFRRITDFYYDDWRLLSEDNFNHIWKSIAM